MVSAPKRMEQSELESIFNSLTPKQSVSVWFDSVVRSADDWTVLQVGRRSKSKKYNVDKISLISPQNPKGSKYYLYNRQGRISFAMGDMATSLIAIKANSKKAESFFAEQKTFEMQPIDKEMMKKFREFRKQMRELPQAEKDKRRKLAMKDREDYLKRKGAETFNAGPNQKPYQIQIGDKFTCGHNIGDAEQPYHDMGNIYADCSSCGTNREIESVGELCEVCGDTYAEKNILLNHAVCKGCWHKNASVGGLEHSGVLAKNAESFAADVKHQCGKCGNSYANLTKAEKCCTESNTIKYGLYGLATLGGISLLSYLKK